MFYWTGSNRKDHSGRRQSSDCLAHEMNSPPKRAGAPSKMAPSSPEMLTKFSQTRPRNAIGLSVCINERVARYLTATPPAVSGNHGHNQTFKVSCALVHGWAKPPRCALCWLRIYNERCAPKGTLEKLVHKLKGAISADHAKPRGHLLGLEGLNSQTQKEVRS